MIISTSRCWIKFSAADKRCLWLGTAAHLFLVLKRNTKIRAQRSALALYTWGMNKPVARTEKSKLLRHSLIILASILLGFYIGGGYRLHNTQLGELFVRHHSQGDDLGTDIISYTTMFLFCGGAGAVAGAGLSSLALFALAKRKKN